MSKGDENSVLCERLGEVMVEWKIPKYLNVPYGSGEELISPTFLLNDGTWYLQIFPKGMREVSPDWMSMFLYRMEGSGEHRVSFSLEIRAGGSVMLKREYVHTFTEESNSWGHKSFITRSTIAERMKENELSDGSLTVVCMARMLDYRLNYRRIEDQCLANFSKSFEEIFIGGHQTDVKLKVRDREFDAHKLVLGARSPVFKAMFQHEMMESNSGVVEISDFDPEVFNDFLLFVYTGKCDRISFANALDLYKASDKYDFKDLRTKCILQMAKNFTSDNILDIIAFAMTREEMLLLDAAVEYFIENGEEIILTQKWKTLYFENTELANDLLVKLARKCKAACKT